MGDPVSKLSFMSRSSKLMEPKKRGQKNQLRASWSEGDNLNFQLACAVGRGQSCETEPLTCGIWCYRQVDSVRSEMLRRAVGGAELLGV